jgi:hypothetical protein
MMKFEIFYLRDIHQGTFVENPAQGKSGLPFPDIMIAFLR